MSESKTYVFGQDANSSLNALLPFLQQRGIDPAYLYGLMGNNNGGFFGNNALEGIIALIVVAAIFGNGNFGFGGFGGNGGAYAAGNTERELLANMIQRNGVDLSQLSQSINCSSDRLYDAIGQVSTQLCNFAGQNGLSFQQVINSIQAGNSTLAHQISDCCCATQKAILESNYLTERGFCNTNQTLTKGFSDIGYAFRDQTCDIEKAIADSTSKILDGQRAAEMREMQDKLDALREKNAQQAVILNNTQQTAQFAAMLAPIQADLAELKCNQVPVKKIACPETYVPVNNSINATYGLIPTYCGYGAGFGAGFGFNGWGGNCCNNSLWG
ncbi:MAG: hypothetical protein II304_00340 [Bacteroidales bacterium]|nr:hypothetical protein [Bacteroidales bacterium]